MLNELCNGDIKSLANKEENTWTLLIMSKKYMIGASFFDLIIILNKKTWIVQLNYFCTLIT